MLQVLPLRSIGMDHAQQVMNTNVLSAMEITRLLTRKNVNQKNLSRIVFISTTASQFGAKGFTAYCASKAALDGLMRALAVELAPQVRVNSVLPGAVQTPMTQAMFDDPELGPRLTRDYPLGVGQMSDIVNAVEFLLSDKSRWMTGQQMVVDGGRTINISA
jgi:NAD(P)-dependent dehydrogenase (short-subunit alcohol dehydrogenase family)